MAAPRAVRGSAPAAPARPTGWRAVVASFGHAWSGVVETARDQRNMRLHLLAAIAVGVAGGALRLGTAEQLALLLCVFLVTAAEVANSALEALVDLVTQEHHELARRAKDAGAGAVLLLAAGAVAVALVVVIRAVPGREGAAQALLRAAVPGVPLLAAAAALLVPIPRPRAADPALGVVGALLLAFLASWTENPAFTLVAAGAFAVAVATAYRRRAG